MAPGVRRVCRICLRKDTEWYNIFNSYYEERNTLYCDMLAYCTKAKLHKKDGLPHTMCKNCIEHLENMYEFNIICEDSEKKFNALMFRNSQKALKKMAVALMKYGRYAM